jgi:cytochrome c oxidase assembly protein subunit 15
MKHGSNTDKKTILDFIRVLSVFYPLLRILHFVMSDSAEAPEPLASPRWLHRWALLTVCATVPLLFLGAEVTTKKVGMVDDVGFREPWHLFVILDQALYQVGLLIEHSHRLAGFIVGTCAIVMVIGLWCCEPRRWLRWFGVAALVGISIQGVLGILRVNLNELMGRQLALVHGCFAQLVFALLVGLALCTSRGWSTAPLISAPAADWTRLRRWSILTTGLIYLQLVLGGFVRHTTSLLGQRGHLLVAFAVAAAVAWLLKLVLETQAANKPLTSAVKLLAALVVLQVLLGIEAWMMKFAAGFAMADLQPIPPQQELIRTAHFIVGSAVFAAAVVVTLRAHRQLALAPRIAPVPVGRMEGAT